MSDNTQARRIAHLQLDAARHFMLISHNGDRLHIAGDIAMAHVAQVLCLQAKANNVPRADLLDFVSQIIDTVYAGEGHLPPESSH